MKRSTKFTFKNSGVEGGGRKEIKEMSLYDIYDQGMNQLGRETRMVPVIHAVASLVSLPTLF